MADRPDVREQLVEGALRLISAEGPADLSVRRLAQSGNRSTMCVYTKFTSRQGLLQAVYERAAGELLARLAETDGTTALAAAYREAAEAAPGLYSFLFEHSMAALELPNSLRATLIDDVCELIRRADDSDPDSATALWATMHGLVALQQSAAAPSPSWPKRYLALVGLSRGALPSASPRSRSGA